MAFTDRTIIITTDTKVATFWSENTEMQVLFAHLIVRDVTSFPVTINWWQGNVKNNINETTQQIYGDDVMAPLENLEGTQYELELTENGNYVIALDTFYGKFGEARVTGSDSGGTIRIVSNTVRKK